jgi:phytol kinase
LQGEANTISTERIAETMPARSGTGAVFASDNVPVDGPLVYRDGRRKLVHLLPGCIPFIMWFVYHEDPLPLWNLGVVAGVVALLTVIGVCYPRNVRRGHSEIWVRTCLTYAVPPTVVLLAFPANAEYAAVVLAVLAFGDPAAAAAGRAWGRRKLPWNSEKTVVGLVSFVLVASVMGSVAYWGEARNPRVPFATAVVCGTTAALLGGLVESLASRVDDNLRISIAATVGVVTPSLLLV